MMQIGDTTSAYDHRSTAKPSHKGSLNDCLTDIEEAQNFVSLARLSRANHAS